MILAVPPIRDGQYWQTLREQTLSVLRELDLLLLY